MKKLIVPISVIALAAAAAGCGDEPASTGPDTADLAPGSASTASHESFRTYEVIVENLTPATGEGSSQVLSPPVLATHNPSVRMFRVGQVASPELAAIAEDAGNQGMLDLLGGLDEVYETAVGGGAIPPGASDTYEIRSAPGFPTLSMAFMLVNTNDAFSGLNALKLPEWGEEILYVHAYDAGSEENTELMAHIPGPCCGNGGVRVPTSDRIRMHPGILGVGDLDPETYGWSGPVARITVRRLAPMYDVTITNLTDEGAQVFSPPVIATHTTAASMFRVGDHASEALAALAEDGMTTPMVDALSASSEVAAVAAASGPIPPGMSMTWQIETARHNRRLSAAFMLVNTNDAFSGLDSIVLPGGGGSVTYETAAYDAGTEENTEAMSDIPGPCCGNGGVRVPTMEEIRHHDGIQGHGDLDPAVYGWDDPVASVTVTRIR